MKKALVLIAHPHLKKSKANRLILEQIEDHPQITKHDLYEHYPHFHINFRKEQALLQEHDLIVFQHPLYWYSMPPLLKLWEDEVLLLGFAYGPGGEALKNKDFLLSITTGGGKEAYCTNGYNQRDCHEYLHPYRQVSHLCKMTWHDPYIFHSATRATDDEVKTHGRQLNEFIRSHIGLEKNK